MTYSSILIENLGKRYKLGYTIGFKNRQATLVDSLSYRAKYEWERLFGSKEKEPNAAQPTRRGERGQDFWALKNLDLDIKQGDVLGIIGRNGAGKSTLLKLISRITEPTTGRIRLRGRVASLLEVGTGFHPQLTGRDNIYLNGAILGMKKHEIEKKFDQIVDFAGVEKFLETPIKRYSSGMKVRLAFSVAAHLDPEILIVDEVLAVGDADFQKRCVGKMQDVATNSGRTILFVSHNMASVTQLCDKVIWLQTGQLRGVYPTSEGIRNYLTESVEKSVSGASFERNDKAVQVIEAAIRRDDGTSGSFYSTSDNLLLDFAVEVREPTKNFRIQFTIKNGDGVRVLFSDIRDKGQESLNLDVGLHRFEVIVPSRTLAAGFYVVDVRAIGGFNETNDHLPEAFGFNLEEYEARFGGQRGGVIGTLLSWKHHAQPVPAETKTEAS